MLNAMDLLNAVLDVSNTKVSGLQVIISQYRITGILYPVPRLRSAV